MAGSAGAMVLRCAAGIIAPFLLLLAAGCSDVPGEPAEGPVPPAPLLYEIASADGSVEGWMVGTIHALPAFARWRTPAIETAAKRADLLVVEIATLDDDAALARTFANLSRSPGLPPLDERLPPDLRPALAALMERGGIVPAQFAGTETWAAALTLARIDTVGDPANGVDRALIADFEDRQVRELEGAPAQLAIFDRLPEAAQRAMLAAVVRDSAATASDPERLQRAWLAGDAETIKASTREGVLADPTVREALLTARNRRWAAALGPMLAGAPRPLIAVGAAHLVGPEGLAALLEAQGYRIRRIS
ncbi:TraB/GumN family protein [Erythrobacter sp. CCH5-A1]|uniref:TraB/GumN family protein n=1 Tax=Erythrobacter sp. CCH5-A1 TaxID=1768792 RepID=UPI000AE53318|nr:TraB/GumN family protein [Erythrobacter sp. CCH5-A1]